MISNQTAKLSILTKTILCFSSAFILKLCYIKDAKHIKKTPAMFSCITCSTRVKDHFKLFYSEPNNLILIACVCEDELGDTQIYCSFFKKIFNRLSFCSERFTNLKTSPVGE